MPYTKFEACLIVDEKDEQFVEEAIHQLIDSFLLRRIAVFDSQVRHATVCEVEHFEETRQEIEEA